MTIINIAEARAYANDYESTDEEIESYILVAEKYIEDGVGKVDAQDPRVKLLCKLIVNDIDDKRSMSAAEANSTRLLVQSIKLQLRTQAPAVSNSDTSGVTV